jgi:carbon-monoxide dehydrogenase large subunit
MINPAVVEGQVRGGTAQGIGGVLYEHAIYDENAQFLTATFMDYLVPTAMEVPPIEIVHLETPPISPVNFRGVGEGGAICAPPAITNAIADALGVTITQQPLTPTRILELMGVIPADD